MSSKHQTWSFFRSQSPETQIVVHDPESAKALRELIQGAGLDWQERTIQAQVIPEANKPTPPPLRTGRGPSLPPDLKKPILTAAPREEYKGSERRQHQRFESEFRVVVIMGSHSYRNTTYDVSLGGIKLHKPLPKVFASQQCVIFISHPMVNENVQITCKVIPDDKDLNRIQFADAEPNQIERLEQWLKESQFSRKVA